MERAYATEGKPVVFRAFERHDLRPAADASYASVARELGLSTSQVTNYLHAARRRFRELALQHLRSVVASEAEFKIEARELFGIDVET
jgi:predicted transcriptional regulator